MKKLKTFFFLFLTLNVVFAQTDKLPKQTVDGKTVFVYKIESGDGWYSIARKFSITYSELKMANKNTDKLKVGEKLNIPSKLKSNDPYFEKNKVDENKSVEKKSEKKITHKVASTETLYAIAQKYNVSVDQIKKSNNLKSSTIKKGQVLVISEGKPVKQNVIEKKPDESPMQVINTPKITEDLKPVVVKNEKPEEVVEKMKVEENVKVSKNDDNDDKKIIFANGRQEVNESGVASWIEDESSGSNKYYALHRTAPSGTIIKITNRMNSRSIYVKVVGLLPNTGDNEGIIIKVSKSGAEKLGVIDQRFQASLLYGITASK